MRRPTDGALERLAAIALSLSVVETALPRPVPFMKLGLSNIPLLWAVDGLPLGEFLLLALAKWALSSFTAGTLLTPYALAGLAGAAASALAMLLVSKVFRGKATPYSVSAAGSVASGAAQVFASTLFLTPSVLNIMGPMLLFNLVSGVVTGGLAMAFRPERLHPSTSFNLLETGGKGSKAMLALHVAAFAAVAFTSSVPALLVQAVCALALQRANGRRPRPLPYLVSAAAVVFFNLLSPSGKVLFGFVTEGALLDGIGKALSLTAMVALSQSLASVPPAAGGFVSRVLAAHAGMTRKAAEAKGWREKAEACLEWEPGDPAPERKRRQGSIVKTAIAAALIILSFVLAAVL